MIIKIATCLLAVSVFTGCQTTQSTASSSRQTLEQRMLAQSNTPGDTSTTGEAMPPAEGPEDAPIGEGPTEVARNPALLPTPLLRSNAAASL